MTFFGKEISVTMPSNVVYIYIFLDKVLSNWSTYFAHYSRHRIFIFNTEIAKTTTQVVVTVLTKMVLPHVRYLREYHS